MKKSVNRSKAYRLSKIEKSCLENGLLAIRSIAGEDIMEHYHGARKEHIKGQARGESMLVSLIFALFNESRWNKRELANIVWAVCWTLRYYGIVINRKVIARFVI